MTSLNFHFIKHQEFASIQAEDMATFTRMLVAQHRFEKADINVLHIAMMDHKSSDLMCIVKIRFSTKVDGVNNEWDWICSRAKDFCCSQSEFTLID